MDTYIKTIINGLKAWVTSCLSRLESSVSGSLATMADKLTSLSSKVQQAQTTATNAQSTATQAQTTATQAQTTATQAQTTATQAQTTATQAQTTATQAQTTATQAQTTATQAQTTASNWGKAQEEELTLEPATTPSSFDILGYHLIVGERYTANNRGWEMWDGSRMVLAYGSGQINVRFYNGKYTIGLPANVVKGSITGKFVKVPTSRSDNFASPAPYLAHSEILICSNSNSRKVYRITVSEDGVLTTTEVTE